MSKLSLLSLLLLIPVFLFGYPENNKISGEKAQEFIPGAKSVYLSAKTGGIEFVELIESMDIDSEHAPSFVLEALGLGKDYTLELAHANKGFEGERHVRFYLNFKDARVFNGMLVLHFKDEKLKAFNGDFLQEITAQTDQVLSKDDARQIALDVIGANLYRWEIPAEEEHLRWETQNPDATYFPEGELVLYPVKNSENASHRYAWRYDIYSVDPIHRNEVFVDAANGEILENIHLLCHIDKPGTAVTYYSGNQTITADSIGTVYRLQETGRGNGIETYNMQTGTSYSAAVDFVDDDNYWNNANAQLDQVATDAHWGAEMTYDYYDSIHNRNSIDDNGFALRSYVHYDYAYANAFWDGYRMTYGDGNGSMGPLVALDIVAHEIAHGLTSYTSSLVYSYESGALNEAFSDIFGTAVEFFAKPNAANWTIGEDIGGAFRSMSNPNAYGDPDTYLGNNWYTGSGDNGGVHTNSGVLNHWFYLLSEGGTGVNDNGDAYSLNGIGILNAGKVAYRMQSVYLTSNDQYADARFYGIKSAIDLFGACSPEVESVTNAFYAIGVGPAYINGVVASFEAIDTSFCSLPAQVNFSNVSVNGVNFNWNFGDGNASSDVDPIHYYNAAGTYDVVLVADGGACGMDTLIKQAYINVNPPAKPQVIHGESCGPGVMTLVANAQDSVVWYAPGGVFMQSGDTFTTPFLSQSTAYYAYNVQASPAVYGGKPDNSGGGGYFSSSNSHHLLFDCSSPSILKSVKVYASSAGVRTIELRNSSGTVLVSKNVNIPVGQSRITLDFNIPVGTDLQLAGPGSPDLFRNSSGCNYPYTVGSNIVITESSAWTNPVGYYYYFYDWEVEDQPCVSEYATAWAYVNSDGPSADYTYSQQLDPVVFVNQSTQGNSFFWDFGDGNTSIEENPTHLYASSGVYSVKLVVSNACGMDSIIQQVPIIITNTTEDLDGELKLYPNPARTQFSIQGLDRFSGDLELKVFSAGSKLVLSRLLSEADVATIDVADWPNGIYIVALRSNKLLIQRKLILAR